MARWTAQVFVDSNVGTITANVEASTHTGAEQQIRRIYGPVQQIVNLRQVSSGGGGGMSSGGAQGGLGLAVLLLIGAAMLGGGKGDKTAPTAPVASPERYEAPAPAPAAAPQWKNYASPSGPCVTDNFEPC